MALQVKIKVTPFTQLQHSGKGAAVQLEYVQQCNNSGMPVSCMPVRPCPLRK